MRKLRSILLAIAGAMSIVMGIIQLYGSTRDYYGDFVRQEEYGGDAYTGIQNACAVTAMNVATVRTSIGTGIAYLLLVGGVALIGVAIPVGDDKTRQQPVPQEARNEPAA